MASTASNTHFCFAQPTVASNEHTVDLVGGRTGRQPVISGGVAITGMATVECGPENLRRRCAARTRREAALGQRPACANGIELSLRGRTGASRAGHGAACWCAESAERSCKNAKRLELRATGFFTERISPVERVAGNDTRSCASLRGTTTSGDTTPIEKPFGPQFSHLYLDERARADLATRAVVSRSQHRASSICAHLTESTSTGRTWNCRVCLYSSQSAARFDDPVQDLSMIGIRFSYSSWLGPSSDEGYASQQSGTFLAGKAAAYPADPIATCAQGCSGFESMRNQWQQMPAAIQVSAARRITFEDNIFAHLGQYALGIGNDADAMLSGVGLATGDITVVANYSPISPAARFLLAACSLTRIIQAIHGRRIVNSSCAATKFSSSAKTISITVPSSAPTILAQRSCTTKSPTYLMTRLTSASAGAFRIRVEIPAIFSACTPTTGSRIRYIRHRRLIAT